MKKLILTGPIGSGKTSLIREALGHRVHQAGGFVTVRRRTEELLLGFDLAPPAALADPSVQGQRFLSFFPEHQREYSVFAVYGRSLLELAQARPFAVADEFGGLELMVPEFRDGLYALLSSPIPCIGVLKAPESARILAGKTGAGDAYFREYEALRDFLSHREDVRILKITGWQDEYPKRPLCQWVKNYAGGAVFEG